MSVERFGDQLRRLRTAAGMTQEDLAERSGLSVRGISDLERGLKQRPHPETIRLLAEALQLADGDLAALRASATPRARLAPLPLPGSLTPLVDREDERAALSALVHPGARARLVTLTGPGGVGKSRLAQHMAREVGERFADGVAFVALAGLNDPTQVLPAIAAALGLRDLAQRSPLDLLNRELHERQVLVVLDNVEHLLAAVPDVAALLAGAPGLSMLATSRSPLHISGEQEYPLAPLALPAPGEAGVGIGAAPAVQLFVQHAQGVQARFAVTEANAPAVAAICGQVDGLPLALELAAGRLKTLAPADLAALLGRRLDVLAGGPRDHPARHQAMRAAIAWSHDLLSDDERETFRRFAVFPIGATLEAATAVLAPGDTFGAVDRITALLDLSLVHRVEGVDGQSRFVMLETIREFALEQLAASDDNAQVRDRHTAYFMSMAEEAGEEGLYGPHQAIWMRRLETDYVNLRAALAWLVARGDAAASQQFARALWLFWTNSGRLRDGREWLDKALALGTEDVSIDRARALMARANIAVDLADYPSARASYEASLAMFRALGDEVRAARALHGLGLVQLRQGAYVEARDSLTSLLQLWRETGARMDEAQALLVLGFVEEASNKFTVARRAYEEALAIRRELGDENGVAWLGVYLGRLDRLEGHVDDARRWLARARAGLLKVDDRIGLAYVLHELGWLAHETNDDEVALARHLDALTEMDETGTPQGVVECLEGLAAVAIARGETAHGVILYSAAAAWRRRQGAPLSPPLKSDLDRDLATARAAISPDAFAIAWDGGQRIGLDAAIDLARSGSP